MALAGDSEPGAWSVDDHERGLGMAVRLAGDGGEGRRRPSWAG